MQIKGITFTERELDIIACIMHLKGSKKIAQILEQNIPEQQEDQIEGLQNHQDDQEEEDDRGVHHTIKVPIKAGVDLGDDRRLVLRLLRGVPPVVVCLINKDCESKASSSED